MAILVSGGAGYIGSHTCVELLAAGYDIVVADNFYNSCPEALARVKKISGKDFRFVEADMTDKEAVEKSLPRIPISTASSSSLPTRRLVKASPSPSSTTPTT